MGSYCGPTRPVLLLLLLLRHWNYELRSKKQGAFSAKPKPETSGRGPLSRTTHGGAGGGGRGAGGCWVSDRGPGHAKPGCALEMSPLRGEVRAVPGARLWARGPARRSWAATGPKPKPGGAGGVRRKDCERALEERNSVA
jgi:hypothetical protein